MRITEELKKKREMAFELCLETEKDLHNPMDRR